MHKLGALGALCVTAQISFSIATAAAAGVSPLSGVPGPGAPGPDRAVVLVGGMGGGGAGMGGGGAGMGGAGMGGGFGGMGGAGMRGAQSGFGDSFLGPSQDSRAGDRERVGRLHLSVHYACASLPVCRPGLTAIKLAAQRRGLRMPRRAEQGPDRIAEAPSRRNRRRSRSLAARSVNRQTLSCPPH